LNVLAYLIPKRVLYNSHIRTGSYGLGSLGKQKMGLVGW